jgi:hypothetical protein
VSGAKLSRCPAPGHGRVRGDVNASLLTSRTPDGRLRVHCFAGCDPRTVMAALGQDTARAARGERLLRGADRVERARGLWAAAWPIGGTAAERYLKRRGLAPAACLSPALRFLPAAWHRQAPDGAPALVAALSDESGAVRAVQRLYLTPGGGKALVDPVRMALGPFGRSSVRLFPAEETLGVAEGVETALATRQLFEVPVWAACSASRLHVIALPADVRRVIIFADNDRPGLEAAHKAALAFRREGRSVEVRPPERQGSDWLDVLASRDASGRGRRA